MKVKMLFWVVMLSMAFWIGVVNAVWLWSR